ncbi:class I SAM-dependent methyltransferase [Kiloniella majae]|uniref:class I SAM-dependent methyltransferase n=1 Tax=Kiloniella majae TaxID=1938558 RepID=UPI000A27905A|nr:class I SAM-dependent methyltransferase [Kiloniella majae]
MRNTNCLICNGELGKEILTHSSPDRFEKHVGITDAGYTRSWLECNNCKSATNVHKKENLDRLRNIASNYYEVDFKSSSIPDKYNKIMNLPDTQSDNTNRVYRIQSTLSRLSLFEGNTSRILDIGAGTGVFLSKFLQEEAKTNRKWEAVAVEPDPHAVEHLNNINLFQVDPQIYDETYETGNFDLITLNKVVEHIEKPNVLISSAGKGLKREKGILYVEVPDVLTIGRRPDTDNIVGSLHNFLYSSTGLDLSFRNAGMETLEIFRFVEPSGKLTVAGFAVWPEFIDRWSK